MKVCSIASGSSGNCTFIGTDNTKILIDAGVSRKRIVDGLKEINVAPQEIDAIFVTHEHTDHIQGIPMMSKMFGTNIYATGGTLDGICAKDSKNIVKRDTLYQLRADQSVAMGELEIMPFSISHDANEPVCYTIKHQEQKVSIATDLGEYTDYTLRHLADSDILLLEANHDISMLEAGPYPYYLKRRILSEKGHLSNEDSGKMICELMHNRLQHVFLSHLSKENNYPMLALEAVKCQIWEETGMKDLPFHLEVSKRDQPTGLVSI